MKVLSLFDGISGAAQALKELGVECDYYASEIDKYTIQISKANHPDIIQIGDVKGLVVEDGYIFHNQNNDPMKNGGSFKADIDLLVAGFPCQSFSIAGNQKGFGDERGQLFFDLLRILNQVKPKYFIFENVFSMGKANKAFIDEKLGIGHIMINSALVTAQCRKRIYWVGKLVNGKYEQVKIDQPEDRHIYLKDILTGGEISPIAYSPYNKKFNQQGKAYSLGTNPQCRTAIAGQLVFDKPVRVGHFNKGGQGDRVYSTEGKSICLSATSGGLGSKTGLYAIAQRGRYENGKVKQKLETSYSEKANALTTVQKDSLFLDLNQHNIRRPTPTECERLQGFPDGFCSMVSNTQAYKALGNSFTVPVIKHILWSLF
jgi:DNA-cytosine methyltransferase